MTTSTVLSSQDPRWRAIQGRDQSADGTFYYAVRSTGVYCRPGCSSRLPRPENVELFDTWAAAERRGYRACKKCRPRDVPSPLRVPDAVVRACEILAHSEPTPKLGDLARQVGLSPFHLQRLFKRTLGVSPKAFASARRSSRLRDLLTAEPTVTRALLAAGYESASRAYEQAKSVLGMTPGEYRGGGSGQVIQYAVARCALGYVLVAATARGICAIELGDSPRELTAALQARLPKAACRPAAPQFQATLSKVIALIDAPRRGPDLPLDMQGTAFQRRVWEALQRVPAGTTVTYAELAWQIGRPRAVRAVAGAVAANRIAIAVPCHRAVRTDGRPSGYRWGLARKSALQAKEIALEK